jgi:hypothetical protein
MGRETGTLEVPFIKGHMGGNTIAILPGAEIPEEGLLERVLFALQDTHLGCHEAGVVYPPSGSGHLPLKIVGRSSRKFLTACGGLTQVLGAAIGSGLLAEVMGFGPSDPSRVVLETEAGEVFLSVGRCEGKVRTETDMTPFMEEIRQAGVEEIRLEGTRAMRAGKFLVVCADDLLDRFGTGEIVALAPRVRSALTEIQSQFLDRYPQASLDYAVYDLHPESPGNLGRLVFPHWLPEGHVEPACGTGTVAVCSVLALLGRFSGSSSSKGLEVRFESGGGPDLGGPDTTTVFIGLADGEIGSIRFSHSRVEITSRGRVMPGDNP